MKLLYSNILPLGTKEHQQTIKDCFEEQFQQSDEINIAVGYVSNASLEELNMLVSKYNIKKLYLIWECILLMVCRKNISYSTSH